MIPLNEMRLLSDFNWLGREGSNLRMAESKSAALPLGYAPTSAPEQGVDSATSSGTAGL